MPKQFVKVSPPSENDINDFLKEKSFPLGFHSYKRGGYFDENGTLKALAWHSVAEVELEFRLPEDEQPYEGPVRLFNPRGVVYLDLDGFSPDTLEGRISMSHDKPFKVRAIVGANPYDAPFTSRFYGKQDKTEEEGIMGKDTQDGFTHVVPLHSPLKMPEEIYKYGKEMEIIDEELKPKKPFSMDVMIVILEWMKRHFSYGGGINDSVHASFEAGKSDLNSEIIAKGECRHYVAIFRRFVYIAGGDSTVIGNSYSSVLNLLGFGDRETGGKNLLYFLESKEYSIVEHSVTRVYIPEFKQWVVVDPTIYCSTFDLAVKEGKAKEGFEQRAIDSCSVCVPFEITSRLYYPYDGTGLSAMDIIKREIASEHFNSYDRNGNLFKPHKDFASIQAIVSKVIELPFADSRKYAER